MVDLHGHRRICPAVDIVLAAAGGNESLAASYVIGISAIIVAAIAVLAIVLLRYANGLADGDMPQDAREVAAGYDDLESDTEELRRC